MLLLFLKSIIIGIANIIPGVSGGTLAVMLNVYDPITEKIGNFFLVDRKTKVSYFLYLLVVLIGAGTGIFLFANLIKYSITNFPKITVGVFTLLILPSIPYIVKGLDYKKRKNILSFIYGAIIMIVFIFLSLKFGDKTTGAVSIQLGENSNFATSYLIKLFFCGLVAAGAMIIPGISGSLLLMMLGEYYNVVYLISSLSLALKDKNYIIFIPLLVLALGVGAGLVIFSKGINYLLKNYRERTLFFIEGIIVFSIIQMWLSI